MNKTKTNRLKALLAIVIVTAVGPKNYAQTCNKVIDVNFNNYGNGASYNIQSATTDFSGISSRGAGEIRGLDGNGKTWPQKNVVVGGTLRAEYKANAFGGPNGGFLFDKTFPDTEEAIMEYKVKFGTNFYWAAGGKLPGLAGSTSLGNASIPDGCTDDTYKIENGFSARIMWRPLAQTPTGWGGPKGRLVVYTYMPDRDLNDPQQRCGVDLNASGDIVADTWYIIKQHIKLNTPGQRNGLIELYINGSLVYRSTNNLFRNANKGNVKINSAMFQTYRGGGNNNFNSPRTENIYFDDFKVWINCANVTPVPPTNSNLLVNGAIYKIEAKHSGKSLDVLNVSTANGANVQQYGYGGGNNQKWRAESIAGGFWKFISINSGKCLEVSAYSNADGGNIQQWDYIGHNYQQWQVESLGDGSFKVTNRGSGKVLDVEGISTADGANIHQWTYLNANNQKWIFTRLDGAREAHDTGIEMAEKFVFPNPTTGLVSLEVLANTNIQIFDLLGKMMYTTAVTKAGIVTLDLNELKEGIYLVQTTHDTFTKSQKLVLKR
jgi:Ricin-type beta-trefoil lectin domain-like/Secretion system C-terminal sorting domain